MKEETINISDDFSLPKKLLHPKAQNAWQAIIEFLYHEDQKNNTQILRSKTGNKIFSREFKDLRDEGFFETTMFFIHHNELDNRLKKWFNYNDDNFKNLFNFLKKKDFFVEKYDEDVSGIFIIPGVKNCK